MNTHFQRTKLAPWGLHGGKDGTAMEALIQRSDGRVEVGNVLDGARIGPGDRMVVRSAGGGGLGDPLEREAERVALDVANGHVSRDAALTLYGVVLKPGRAEADLPATLAERARRAAPQPKTQELV